MRHIDETAFEVVSQKFNSCKMLRELLLSTGNSILAEAAPNDSIWGIGLRIDDDRTNDPSKWCGRNVLGYALMKARRHMRGEPFELPSIESSVEGAKLEPIEGESFLRPISDLQAVRDCYDRYGVVGVTGVLNEIECHTLVSDGFEPFLPRGCRMNETSTFDLAGAVMNRYGVIGKDALFNRAILAARLHRNVALAYATVLGRSDVFACHDRCAWMRPVALNAAWDTPFSWPGLHVDVSPRNYFNGSRSDVDDYLRGTNYSNLDSFVKENNAKHVSMGRTVQGVLNLYDNEEEDGGFQCVPGMFGELFHDWERKHQNLPPPEVNGRYELRGFGPDAELGRLARRIPCPAGTLILFDTTLPHGTKPNASARSRAVLFLRYMQPEELPPEVWQNRNAALRRVAQEVGFEPNHQEARNMYWPE